MSVDAIAEQISVRTASEELLLALYAREPGPELEEELLLRFLPLARSLARRYSGRFERNEDLIQVASLALLKALRGYDPDRGRVFSAYAAPTILGELKRHFRDHSWRLHMPRNVQENTITVTRAVDDLTNEERAPSPNEVADSTGLTVEEVLEALQARESQRSVSLDGARDQDDDALPTLADALGSDDPGIDRVEAQMAVERCAGLTARERRVLVMRFARGLNQYEISEQLGVSQMQISRIMRRALAKLLEAVAGDDAPDGRKTFERRRRNKRTQPPRVDRRSVESIARAA